MPAMSQIISFVHVSKRFAMQREHARSFQDALVDIVHRRRGKREPFWALKDVSFSVNRGEMVGLIGPNGAGKSTILKLMTRILEPTSGNVRVNGRVAALLELGTGFHPDLTGRENVFLNGSLIGLSRRQMEQRLDSIIDFAGMERFIDVPVRHYSSGMYMRLGFSVAIHSDPAILITDEVLAVGDEAFQNKCLERMSRFRDEGATIVLVSHALPIVRRLCSRTLWLSQGSIVMDGATDAVVDAYVADVTALEQEHETAVGSQRRPKAPAVTGLADARLLSIELLGPEGKPRWDVHAGERMTVRAHYQAHGDYPEAALALQIVDAEDQTPICAYNSSVEGVSLPMHDGAGYVDVTGVPLPLRAGRFLVSAALYRQPDPPAWANPDDLHHKAYTLRVRAPYASPQRRWGNGQALVSSVRLCNANDQDCRIFQTGAPLRLHLRCISAGEPVSDAVLRVQIVDSNGVLCHATNSERAGLDLGVLDRPRGVLLTYDSLRLLAGEYVLSVGLTPAGAPRRPYDWHDAAYRLRVESSEADGAGIANLRHHWAIR